MQVSFEQYLSTVRADIMSLTRRENNISARISRLQAQGRETPLWDGNPDSELARAMRFASIVRNQLAYKTGELVGLQKAMHMLNAQLVRDSQPQVRLGDVTPYVPMDYPSAEAAADIRKAGY